MHEFHTNNLAHSALLLVFLSLAYALNNLVGAIQ